MRHSPVPRLFLQNSVPLQQPPHPRPPLGTGVLQWPLQGLAQRHPARRSPISKCRAALPAWHARTGDYVAPQKKGAQKRQPTFSPQHIKKKKREPSSNLIYCWFPWLKILKFVISSHTCFSVTEPDESCKLYALWCSCLSVFLWR